MGVSEDGPRWRRVVFLDIDGVLNSAHYLNERMREMRSGGRVVGAERIAVITALNITHEFLKLQSGSAADPERIESIRGLSDRIETTLNKHSETSV